MNGDATGIWQAGARDAEFHNARGSLHNKEIAQQKYQLCPHWEILADCDFQTFFDQDAWSHNPINTYFWNKSFMQQYLHLLHVMSSGIFYSILCYSTELKKKKKRGWSKPTK